MELSIYCAMCNETKQYEFECVGITLETPLGDFLEKAKKDGWVIEQNGEYLDLYCSEYCAKSS